jgi:hypothetical protein
VACAQFGSPPLKLILGLIVELGMLKKRFDAKPKKGNPPIERERT